MSYTTVYALWPGERHEELEDLRNAWGTAPVVWGKMSARYCGREEMAALSNIEKLWPLWKRLDIKKSHRAVLLMTYDDHYVGRENYTRAAADIRAFLADFSFHPNRVNHWLRIAEIFETNPDCPAIGFQWTSVGDNPWSGEWNEEKEEYEQPDWACKCEMYAELDALDTAQEGGAA